MVAAVGDVGIRLFGRQRALKCVMWRNRVHFVEGGQWREELVGTQCFGFVT